MLEDRANGSIADLSRTADELLAAARQRPELGNVVSTFETTSQYEVSVDVDKAQTLGIPVSDVYDSLQTFLGGLYVNDFNRFGRTWKVLMQADAQYRDRVQRHQPVLRARLSRHMAPLGTLVSVKEVSGPEVIYRYNRYRAIRHSRPSRAWL